MSLTRAEFSPPAIETVLTQFRESQRLLAVIETDIDAAFEAVEALCALPASFHIDTAVGDQLTIIGKWLGFPRCHCVCAVRPVFGFDCAVGQSPYVTINTSLCGDVTFAECDTGGVTDLCLDDDETYRRHLYSRIYQMLNMYDLESLAAACKAIWGDGAQAFNMEFGRVAVWPGRELTNSEALELPISLRAMPIAPGIEARVQFGAGPLFQPGADDIDLCNAQFLCPEPFDAYACQ